MEIVPGIRFTDGVSQRVPVMVGTGLEVWEVVGQFKALDEDLEELYDAFDWLSKEQIDAALAYYRLFPAEVDERIAEDAWWEPEAGNVTYPIRCLITQITRTFAPFPMNFGKPTFTRWNPIRSAWPNHSPPTGRNRCGTRGSQCPKSGRHAAVYDRRSQGINATPSTRS
jgi:uncharacterized protein (DUF433 family)